MLRHASYLGLNEDQEDSLSDEWALLDTTDIPSPEEIKEENQTNSNACMKTRRVLNLGALAFGSVLEILQFYTGLNDIFLLGVKLLGIISLEDAKIRLLLTAVYAAQAFSLNKAFTNEGIDEICRILHGEKIPEWTDLPSKAARKANIVSILMNTFGLISDAAQTAYYFLQEANESGVELNSGTIAGIVIISSLSSTANIPTEGLETHLYLRTLFAEKNEEKEEKPLEPPTTAEKIAGNIFTPLAKILQSFGAAEDMIQSYITLAAMLTALLSVTNPSVRLIVLIFSILNGVIDTMFNGKQTSEALELFKESLLSGNYGAKEVSALLMSLFAASIVAHSDRSVTFDMLSDPEAPFPFFNRFPDWMNHTLANGAFARQFVNEGYYFYPLVIAPLNLLSRLVQKPQTASDFDFEYKPTDEEWVDIVPELREDKVEDDDEWEDYALLDKNMPIFQQPLLPKKPVTEEKEETSCWARMFTKQIENSTKPTAAPSRLAVAPR